MGFSVIAVLGMALAGCDGCPADPAPGPDAQAPAALFADVEATPEVMGLWSRSCVLCHANGAAGAPRVGDRAAWGPRLEQGEDTLLAHTVEGYNEMPPLGYCMACDRMNRNIDVLAGSVGPEKTWPRATAPVPGAGATPRRAHARERGDRRRTASRRRTGARGADTAAGDDSRGRGTPVPVRIHGL